MKIVAAMICFNAEPYLYYAIKSILPHVDHLILVYGAQEEFKHQTQDNTQQIITQLEHGIGTTQIIVLGNERGYWDNEADQRNAYLNYIKRLDLDPDWLWVVDSDEFYKPEDIKKIKAWAQYALDNKDLRDYVYGLLYPFMNFYGRIPDGFNYYKKNDIGMLKFVRWYNDLIYHYDQPQLLDNIGNSKYKTLWHFSGIASYGDRLPIIPGKPCCYHYGHVHTYDNYIRKLLGSCVRDKANLSKQAFQHLALERKKQWIELNYSWFKEDWIEKLGLTRFDGTHPEPIQEMRKDNGW